MYIVPHGNPYPYHPSSIFITENNSENKFRRLGCSDIDVIEEEEVGLLQDNTLVCFINNPLISKLGVI